MSESIPAISSSLAAEPEAARTRLLRHGSLWLLGPYVLVLVAFLAVPLGNIGVLSFFTSSSARLWSPVLTLANYRQIANGYFLDLVGRTLAIGAVATVICAALGYPLAYYLARCSRAALAIALFLLIMPLMVSAVIEAFGWIAILGREGLLNTALASLGVTFRVDVLYSQRAVLIALVQLLLPVMTLPLMSAIEDIPVRLEEVAQNLGASPLVAFRRVLLPLSLPGLVSGGLLCFTVAISVVVTPALLGGRLGRMLGNEIYDQALSAYDWPFASSLAMVLVLLVFAAIAAILATGPRRQTRGGRA
jgi:putative spermidine/putrescine transport system permease protein